MRLQSARWRAKCGAVSMAESQMPAPILVFDLDGTLADTMRDLIPVLNRTTAREGLGEIPFADVGHVVGHGARAMIEKAFSYHGRELDPAVHDRLFDVFLEDYAANLSANTVLFDGANAALDHFAGSGWLLGVCTNKPEKLAVRLLDELGVLGRFAAVTGGDSYAYRKPDPRHLLGTIESAGGDPASAIMVGDSRTDIDTARNAGVPVVAVDFGYTDIPVRDLYPDRVISHFGELRQAVEGLIAPEKTGDVRSPALQPAGKRD
jgi:phosphoglycolate phosphatase